MAKPKHYCCTSRGGARSPDEQNVRPTEHVDQRNRLLAQSRQDDTTTTLTELTNQVSGSETEDPTAVPLELGDTSQIVDTSRKPKLTSRLRERLSFGQHSRRSRVLIKTPHKQPPQLRKPSIFAAYHDSPSMDLALDDARTPSRGGYDYDARIISEQQLLDGTLVSVNNSSVEHQPPENTCHTDVTQTSSGNATSSSGEVSRTTPGATSSSTTDSEGLLTGSDESRSSTMSIWDNENEEMHYVSRRDHCVRLPTAPRLELRSFSGSDLSLRFVNTSSQAEPTYQILHASQAPIVILSHQETSMPASETGEVLWDADKAPDILTSAGASIREDGASELASTEPFTYSMSKEHEFSESDSMSPKSVKSLHLPDMRISQHLRSFSSLSRDSVDTSASGVRHHKEEPVDSEVSSQVSSAGLVPGGGFKSHMVPHSWGKVVTRNAHDGFIPGSGSIDGIPSSLAASLDDTELEILHRPSDTSNADDAAEPLHSELGPSEIALVPRPEIHVGDVADPVVNPANEVSLFPIIATPEPPAAEEADVDRKAEARQSARKKSFGHLLERSKLFDHVPKLRLKIGSKASNISLDGATGSPTGSIQGDREGPSATVGSNFEETANVWESALNAHRLHVAEGRSSPSRAPHRMSFSALVRSPLSGAAASPDTSKAQPRARHQSIGLRHLDTEHSFDRLTVPGKPHLARARRLTAVQEIDSTGRSTLHGHDRSRSHPAPRGKARGREKVRRADSKSGRSSSMQSVARESALDLSLRGRSTSAVNSWSNYPAHTRSDRSLSAGIPDGIITRDFAPSSIGSDEESQIDPGEKTPRQKRRSVLMRNALIRKTLLTDLPSLFRPFSTGFRKGESGHRTSVALGGALEYPELELLPAGEEHMMTAAETSTSVSTVHEPSGTKAIDNKPRRTLSGSQREPSSAGKQRLVLASTSSTYPTVSRDHNINDAYSASSKTRAPQHLSASDWSRVYGDLVTDIGTDSDARKARDRATDGADDLDQATPYLTTTVSMPSLTRTRNAALDQAIRSKLTKSYSVDPMRLSTQNLIEMLDRGLEKDIARALEAADDAWKHGSSAQ